MDVNFDIEESSDIATTIFLRSYTSKEKGGKALPSNLMTQGSGVSVGSVCRPAAVCPDVV